MRLVQGGAGGVPVRIGVGLGGRELRGDQGGPVRAEHVGVEELPDDAVQGFLGGLRGRRVAGHSVEIELVALDVLHHDARLVVVIGRQ